MDAIFGFLGERDTKLLHQMGEALSHRGPGLNVHEQTHASLGYRGERGRSDQTGMYSTSTHTVAASGWIRDASGKRLGPTSFSAITEARVRLLMDIQSWTPVRQSFSHLVQQLRVALTEKTEYRVHLWRVLVEIANKGGGFWRQGTVGARGDLVELGASANRIAVYECQPR
ncbi:MAG: hypothetical protein AAGJ56_10980, partial [Myxococcota bacterium]